MFGRFGHNIFFLPERQGRGAAVPCGEQAALIVNAGWVVDVVDGQDVTALSGEEEGGAIFGSEIEPVDGLRRLHAVFDDDALCVVGALG